MESDTYPGVAYDAATPLDMEEDGAHGGVYRAATMGPRAGVFQDRVGGDRCAVYDLVDRAGREVAVIEPSGRAGTISVQVPPISSHAVAPYQVLRATGQAGDGHCGRQLTAKLAPSSCTV